MIEQFGLPLAIIIYLISTVIGLYIVYLIIKTAVSDGTSEQARQLRIQNRLKAEEMKRSGMNQGDIDKLMY